MKYRYFLFFLFVLGFQIEINAQGHKLTINIEGYQEKSLLLANYYGDNQYITDSVEVNENGNFIFKGAEKLPGGIYLIVMLPENDIFQILIDEDQEMVVKTSRNTPAQSMVIEGSKLNTDFYKYLNYLGQRRLQADEYGAALQQAKTDGNDAVYNQYAEQLDAVNAEVLAYQKKLMDSQKDSFLGKIIRANRQVEPPSFAGSEDPEYDRYVFVKNHWFDNINLGDPRFLRTPVMFEKVDYYINKLNYQIPDSLIVAVDYILEKVKPAEESFKFYLIHFLNKYAGAQLVGMDAVYVHIGEKYFSSEKTPWADEEQLAKIQKNVKTLKPLLIGKEAPDLKLLHLDIEKTLERKDDENEFNRYASSGEFQLKGLDKDYTVLFVWSPGCPHCKESLPALMEFYEKWKDRGVEIIALCNNIYKDVPKCAEFIKEKGMVKWINAIDPLIKSKYKQLYDVRTTPQLYVIDREGKIVMKKVQTEDLDGVMEEIVRQKNPGN